MKPSARAVLTELFNRGDGGLTQLQALDTLGCFRLAARVAELRAEGYRITSEPCRTLSGKTVTRYVLVAEPARPMTGTQDEAFA